MKTLGLLVGASLAAVAPVAAQDMTTPAAPGALTAGTPAAAPAPAIPQVTVGASVTDASGAPVGTIASVANGTATVDTGTVKAGVPVKSFAQGQSGLVLGMTKAQLEAAVAQAKPADIAVGTPVVGPQGGPVGTVDAVNGDLVTVKTPTTKVQLPKTAFAQNASGALAISMTAAQLEAAAKAAGEKTGG